MNDLEPLARQLWEEFSLPMKTTENGSVTLNDGQIHASPYFLHCSYSRAYEVPNAQFGTLRRPARIKIAIFDAPAPPYAPDPYREPLLTTTHERPFPDNVIRFKHNWDSRRHLLENNFRLTVVLTRVFSILIPGHMQ